MMRIRPEQMQVLQEIGLARFKEELLAHLAEFAPQLYELRGEECFRGLIDDGLSRAAVYGFTNRGPVRFFLECMVAYGSEFDTDVQHPGVAEILAQDEDTDQMRRADQLFAAIERYQAQTRGPDSEHAVRALRRLMESVDARDELTDQNLEAKTLDKMARIHPEKHGFVGEDSLRELIEHARAVAARFEIATPDGVAALSALMFAMGHGIANDPLYPWVLNTLTSPPGQPPAERIERLRRKSKIYLAETLANLPA